MARAAVLRIADYQLAAEPTPSWHDELRAFLDGDTNGEPLFHAIYDSVLDEPIPARLLEALRG
jgi:hypothetical protein